MLAPDFDRAISGLHGVVVEIAVARHGPDALVVDQHFRPRRSAADLQAGHLRQRLELELQPHFGALLDFGGLRRLGLKTVLGHPHGHVADGPDAQLSALRLPRVLLIVQENANVVLPGRYDQRTDIQVGLEERSERRRRAKTLLHIALVFSFAYDNLVHARQEILEIESRGSGVALRLAVERQFHRSRVRDYARLVAQA